MSGGYPGGRSPARSGGPPADVRDAVWRRRAATAERSGFAQALAMIIARAEPVQLGLARGDPTWQDYVHPCVPTSYTGLPVCDKNLLLDSREVFGIECELEGPPEERSDSGG